MDGGRHRRALLISVILTAVTLLVYAPVRWHTFVDYDDYEGVVENPRVNRGLTREGIAWAFTQSHAANWYPMTYLSHMLDCQLFGLDAGMHLMVNVLIHATSAVLLLAFLVSVTGDLWPSAFVAAVFALHPLRVESVAWVSERKDVLASFFWMLTLLAYLAYVRVPTWRRYGFVGVAFALGLMSKPMLVTLPFVLLLLDIWPLRRALPWPTLVREKMPLMVLAAASSAVTVLAQHRWGAMVPIEAFGLAYRVQNALLSYALYLRDSLWPSGLAVLYPIRDPIAPAAVMLAAVTLVAISALVLLSRQPQLLVGWLWYLGVLVPVIGMVWVGEQSRADRFTYLPQIGLSIMVAWGLRDVLAHGRLGRVALAVGAAAVLVACVVVTRRQIGVWRDGMSLFGRAVAVTNGNYPMHVALGTELWKGGRREEARAQYLEALRLRPDFAPAHLHLGVLLAEEGRADEAIERYQLVMRLRPDYSTAPFNLGLVLAARGQSGEAIGFYEKALRIEPDYPKAHVALALALDEQGRPEEAARHLRAALGTSPDMVEAHGNLALVLERLGQTDHALEEYRETVRLAPGDVRARLNLARVLDGAGHFDEARVQYREALRLKPGAREVEEALARLDPPSADAGKASVQSP